MFISMKETPVITRLLYVSMDSPILDILNIWNRIVCMYPLCLAYFIQHKILWVPPRWRWW